MNQIGAWLISENKISKIPLSAFSFEKELEDLIENDPSLIDSGFTIIGRQVRLSSGRLDLLGLDSKGQFTVLEIKRGSLVREAIAQALDYASEIASMPFSELKIVIKEYLQRKGIQDSLSNLFERLRIREDDDSDTREVAIKVLGVGKIESVERMIGYLTSKSELSIEAIGFQLFEFEGKRLLIRELTEISEPVYSTISLDTITAFAKNHGNELLINNIIEFAKNNNLKMRPYKTSLMISPQQHGNRCLFTIWPEPHADGKTQGYIATDAFQEYFSVSADKIGKNGYVKLNQNEWLEFLIHLNKIFCELIA